MTKMIVSSTDTRNSVFLSELTATVKILYISAGIGADYQCDMLFHGLRHRYGNQVVDSNRLAYMYKSFAKDDSSRLAGLYGSGFSVYALLDDIEIDRDDLLKKIRSKYFDLVIYGSIHRSQYHLLEVLGAYDARNIIFIDGEDESDAIFSYLLGRGMYFKREIRENTASILPIQFAIPREKINHTPCEKSKSFAHIDPRDRSTYIYSHEADDYKNSLFAITTKKAGWDCLRHYEIMANDCIPIFLDLDKCPDTTLVHFPRYEMYSAHLSVSQHGGDYFLRGDGMAIWQAIQSNIRQYLLRHLTTVALADYVIDQWRHHQR
jgi:hypothetical protein